MAATIEVLITARDQASQVMSSIQANSKKMGIGMAATGAAITGSMALSVKSFAAAGDEVAKMAKRTGFSTEALSELKYAAELSGGSLQGIEKGSRRLSAGILDAQMGLKTSIDAFDMLGLSWESLVGQSPEEQMLAVITALADMDDASTQAALAQDLLGRAGTGMLPMLYDGAEGLEEMRKEAHEMGVVFDEEAAGKAELMTDEMMRVNESIRGVSNVIAENLIPAITPMTEKISSIISKVSRWMNENKALSSAIVTVTAAVGAVLIPLGTMLVLLPQLVSGIMAFKTAIAIIKSLTAAQWLWNAALNANPIGLVVIGIASLVAAGLLLWDMWERNRKVALALTVVMLGIPILGQIALIIALVKNWDTVVAVVGRVKDAFVNLVTKLTDIFATVADVIISPFKSSFNVIIGLWNKLLGTISGKTLFDIPSKSIAGQEIFPGWKLTLPSIPPIPALAEGGIVRKPTLAIIGERGPEAVVPLGKKGMGMQVHIHVGAMMGTEHEAREFARMINTYVLEEARLGGY